MKKSVFLLVIIITLGLSACCHEVHNPPEPVESAFTLELPAETSALLLASSSEEYISIHPNYSLQSIAVLLNGSIVVGCKHEFKNLGNLRFTGAWGEKDIILYENSFHIDGKCYRCSSNTIRSLMAMFPEPPAPPKPPLEISGLVRISDLDPTILIDLKYATEDNFTGRIIYPVSVGVIYKKTGEMLAAANAIFAKDGYRIKVWDAYRPYSCQQTLWDACPNPAYVINPAQDDLIHYKARHNNGMSVDITLVDQNGRELEMPTVFDDFSERAHPSYPHMSAAARKNMKYLMDVMGSVGFRHVNTEWWHFNDAVNKPIPYLDVALEAFMK